MVDEIIPDKMKVADLRTALQDRGLDTKGTKPVLVARLQEALDSEKGEEKMETETPEVKEETKPAVAEIKEEKKEEVKKDEPMEEGDSKKEDKKDVKTEEKKVEKKEPPKKKFIDDEPYEVKENEPEIPENFTCLDWYNSDLNLKINNEDLNTAQPFIRDGWGYCYAGARATFGVKSGKVWYEVKYVDNMDVKVDKEPTSYDLRVGWSTNDTSLMLGESDQSWCYSSAEGKMAHGSKFEEYGEKFTKGDVIGAFLEIGNEEVSMTFSKNGEDQGDAYQIPVAEWNKKPLFPHFLTRNVKFQVNFGVEKEVADPKEAKAKDAETKEAKPKEVKTKDAENWKDPISEGFTKVGKVEDKVGGTPRIGSKAECELIMMVGLPGSGKSTWVNKHVEENMDKHYNIISTNEMFKKMTVNGDSRKKVHKGKWEQVIAKATRSLQDLIRCASQRRRNIIIDQTNVFPNAQRRKARPFQGYVRRCVVVVPSDEDYKARVKAQEEAGQKDIPDEAIMEMKANFTLPDCEDPAFAEVRFTDLGKEEAKEVVELYNKVAKEKGYGKKYEEKRTRGRGGKLNRGGRGAGGKGDLKRLNNNMHGRGFNNMRGNMRGGPMRGGMMRGGQMRGGQMRGGPMRGGAMRGGPMRGGQMRGGPMNRGRGGVTSPWANKQMNSMGGGMNNMGMNSMGMNNMGGGMSMNNMGGMGGGMGGMGGMSGMGMGGGMSGMGMNNMSSGMGMNRMSGMSGGMASGMGGMMGMNRMAGGMSGGMGGMSGGMGGMSGGMGGMSGGMGGMSGGMGGMAGGMGGGMGMNNMSSGMGMNNRMGMGMGGGMKPGMGMMGGMNKGFGAGAGGKFGMSGFKAGGTRGGNSNFRGNSRGGFRGKR